METIYVTKEQKKRIKATIQEGKKAEKKAEDFVRKVNEERKRSFVIIQNLNLKNA